MMAQTKTHTCSLCGKPITLVPSAEERSRKTGQPADLFRRLFTQHSACTLAKRKQDTLDLIRRTRRNQEQLA